MGTSLTLEEVKLTVEAIVGRETRRTKDLRDIPFSHEAKELLEQAEQVWIPFKMSKCICNTSHVTQQKAHRAWLRVRVCSIDSCLSMSHARRRLTSGRQFPIKFLNSKIQPYLLTFCNRKPSKWMPSMCVRTTWS